MEFSRHARELDWLAQAASAAVDDSSREGRLACAPAPQGSLPPAGRSCG